MFSRQSAARAVREEANNIAFRRLVPTHLSNGEELDYRNAAGELSYIANYHKGLHHNALGEVVPADYRAMVKALNTGSPDSFEAIPLDLGRKLTNPQSGLAFDLEGPDAHSLAIPPAPRIDSAENAAEMAELYWMALLRDIHFSNYATNTDVAAAAASLSAFSDFRGPKSGGVVTPSTLFRGFTPGDLNGPYVSQFMLMPIPFGTLRIRQRQQTAVADKDYMIDYNEWLEIQRGKNVDPAPPGPGTFDPVRRYIRSVRDLATYVHFDALYEAYLNACLILLDMKRAVRPRQPVCRLENSDWVRYVRRTSYPLTCHGSRNSRVEGGLVPEMVRTSTVASGGHGRAYSQSSKGHGELSDPSGNSGDWVRDSGGSRTRPQSRP